MAPKIETVHSVASSLRACAEPDGVVDYIDDAIHDVELCIRTVVDQECGTLEENRELGLRILRRLGVSPVGPTMNY